MRLSFTKMHGLGNDFVVIDAITQKINLTVPEIKSLANRHFGVGFDQLLLIEKPTIKEADFRYRIFNADGSEVAQCGNGVRCFARFVLDKGLTDKTTITVETNSGLVYPTIAGDAVRVNMGVPQFAPAALPMRADAEATRYVLEIEDATVNVGAVSIGNPHAVVQVTDIISAPVEAWGVQLESHTAFPERVNVGFMEVVENDHINLRVFERGAGETRACGTGACAAVVVGIRQGLLGGSVQVSLPGGDLQIEWAGDDSPVWMTGPAETVFEGTIDLAGAWAE